MSCESVVRVPAAEIDRALTALRAAQRFVEYNRNDPDFTNLAYSGDLVAALATFEDLTVSPAAPGLQRDPDLGGASGVGNEPVPGAAFTPLHGATPRERPPDSAV